jgi:hypothetical protein
MEDELVTTSAAHAGAFYREVPGAGEVEAATGSDDPAADVEATLTARAASMP